jgi:hypothetical protein
MNTFEKIRQWFSDYLKKRYIRGEIKKKFGMVGKAITKRNNEYIEHLTNSLFKASQIVKAEVIEADWKKLEHENKQLFEEVKAVIEKHYGERVEKLQKENEKLSDKVKEKDKKLNELKSKVVKTVTA